MKSILMSDRPKWVAKILNGEKPIEVRKTAPKCNLPIEVYIHCTNPRNSYLIDRRVVSNGMYEATTLRHLHNPNETANIEPNSPCVLNGKVVAKFTLRKVEEILNCGSIDQTDTMYTKYFCGYKKLGITHETIGETRLLEDSNLLYRELDQYLLCNKGYAWHISDLVIFDEPKELSDFSVVDHIIDVIDENGKPDRYKILKKLTKAPQSWQYIERR